MKQNKERPIIFGSEMVKAILEGRKTQTRRVIKPQPASGVRFSPFVPGQVEDGHGRELRCPYAVDRLWVRETWQAVHYTGEQTGYKEYPGEVVQEDYGPKFGLVFPGGGWDGRWRPSIFMPRWASRITLEVVSVRVERLQEISDSDARAEGVLCDLNCRRPFMELWDSINAKRGYGWDSNPWVWVIEFERVTP